MRSFQIYDNYYYYLFLVFSVCHRKHIFSFLGIFAEAWILLCLGQLCVVLSMWYLQIIDDKLLTAMPLNYEAPVISFIIQVQSNDTGKPSLSVTATFTITVLNVNERPTSVNLAPNIVNENSARGTVVGYLTAVDPDSKDVPRQKFTYLLRNNAGSRFEIDGNAVKVSFQQFENGSLPVNLLSPISLS